MLVIKLNSKNNKEYTSILFFYNYYADDGARMSQRLKKTIDKQ